MRYRIKRPLNQQIPRVLVLTLYSGENEIEECLSALDSQSFQNYDHLVISNFPKKEAHDLLYTECMEHSEKYDYFIKLDADMVLTSTRSMQNLLAYCGVEYDKVTVSVFDFFTNSPILGIHLFSNKVRWVLEDEKLFTDSRAEIYPGKRRVVVEKNHPNVNHASNPTEFQAYVFGIHRAIKALQKGRGTIFVYQLFFQFSVLRRVFQTFIATGDKRLEFTLKGAYSVLDGRILDANFLHRKEDYYQAFTEESDVDDEMLESFAVLFDRWFYIRIIALSGWERFWRSVTTEALFRVQKLFGRKTR